MANPIQDPTAFWFFACALVVSLVIAINPGKRVVESVLALRGRPAQPGQVYLLRFFSSFNAIVLAILLVWYLVGSH